MATGGTDLTRLVTRLLAAGHLVREVGAEGVSPSQRRARRRRVRFYRQTWNNAARELGVPTSSCDDGSVEVQLDQERIRLKGSHCSIDSDAVLELAGEKAHVYGLMTQAGLPAPEHCVFSLDELDTARAFLAAAPGPCVVKPAVNSAMGRGVMTNVRTADDLRRAAVSATAAGARVLEDAPRLRGLVAVLTKTVPLLIERQVPGANYRLLFLDGELIDAIRRDPPSVVGDGTSTVGELIKAHNRDRLRAGDAWAQRLVTFDAELDQSLAEQGLGLAGVPAAGATVVVKNAVNETAPDHNHPAAGELCTAVIDEATAAVHLIGARLAGVDVITTDPGRSLVEAGGCILEVNTTPGLAMHHHGHPGAIDPAKVVLRHLVELSGTATAAATPPRTTEPGPPVILLGGAMNALSIARSLAELGVAVHTIGVEPFVEWSRHVRPLPLGRGDDEAARWLATLLGPTTDHLRGAVVLAASDVGITVLARHRDALLERYLLDDSDVPAQLMMLDKLATYEAAAAAGVPTPRFWRLGEPDADYPPDLTYPVIVKPLLSHDYQAAFPGLSKFRVAGTPADLRTAHRELVEAGIGAVLMEQVPGGDELLCSYYTYLDASGTPTFDFTKRAPRRFPSGMGPACYHVTDWNAEVRDVSLRLFKHVGLRGLANAEFKRDPRDGILKLIECNARFTAANCLVTAAGIDLAQYVYRRALGQAPELPREYRKNLHLIHHMIDLRAFLVLRRRGELSLLRWVRSLAKPQTLPVFRWDDPLPAVRRSEIADLLVLVRSRARRRSP